MNLTNPKNRRDSIGTFLVAVLAILLLASGAAYLGTRRVVAPNDIVHIVGNSEAVEWIEARSPRAGLGLRKDWRLITNAHSIEDETADATARKVAHDATVQAYSAMAVKGTRTQYVRFRQGAYVDIPPVELASRVIDNIYGQQLIRWKCELSGVISADGKQACLSLTPTGGGVAGYTIHFAGEVDDSNHLILEITERLWSNSSRRCRLEYELHSDGTVKFVRPLPSL